MANQWAQGDLLFEKMDIDFTQRDIDRCSKVTDRVIARGEKTGHKHVLEGEAELLRTPHDTLMIVVQGESRVVHEEHNPLHLTEGTYRVMRQRVHDYEAEEKSIWETSHDVVD